MGTNNRFKREAKTNLEMAYSRPFAIFIAQHKTRTVNIFPASFTSKWLWQRAFSLYQGSIALLLELKITCQCKTTIENLSNDDKDQRTTPNKTRIYILPSNFLIVYICSESIALQLKLAIHLRSQANWFQNLLKLRCNASCSIPNKLRKIICRRSRSPNYAELSHVKLLFCKGRQKMFKDL